ncbi:GTP-binding nuclear protein [Aphelenchoides besseyi]|nr:GTP-binding nuclear protein [Aphelenchoides besseyi]
MAQRLPTFKLVLVGDSGTGKTKLVEHHLTGEVVKEHIRKCEIVEIVQLNQLSELEPSANLPHNSRSNPLRSLGHRSVRFYDCDFTTSMAIQLNTAIIMFDVTAQVAYKNVLNHHRDLVRVHGNIPMVFVGNKFDVKNRKVKVNAITFYQNKNLQLEFVPMPTRLPPEIPMELGSSSDEEMEMVDIQMAKLPDDY